MFAEKFIQQLCTTLAFCKKIELTTLDFSILAERLIQQFYITVVIAKKINSATLDVIFDTFHQLLILAVVI